MLQLTEEHQMFRQTVRDYIVDQQFRRDYWVKGLRRIGIDDQDATGSLVEPSLARQTGR